MSGSFVESVAVPGFSVTAAIFGDSGVTIPCASMLIGVRTLNPNATLGLGRASAPTVPANDVAVAWSVARESQGWYSTFLQASPTSPYETVVWSKLPSTRCAESPRSSHGVTRKPADAVG